jgi:nitrate/nitrite transport system substrate-binding protein
VDGLRAKKEATFAMTFPGGTHDLWLRYWLGAAGIDQNSVKIITVPPAQMVANMKVNNMDGFCVGEPWGGVAVQENIGFTHISTQDIWRNHPEKALVLNKEFNDQRDDEVRAVMRAVLEASMWLDVPESRQRAAEVVGRQAYVNAPASVIDARLMGRYDLGCDLGQQVYRDDAMLFYNGGQANFPRKAHGIWFMSQYVRFGYLKEAPEYARIADLLIYQDRYREVAREMGIPLPDDDMRPFTLQLDNVTFDPNDPAGSLAQYRMAAA